MAGRRHFAHYRHVISSALALALTAVPLSLAASAASAEEAAAPEPTAVAKVDPTPTPSTGAKSDPTPATESAPQASPTEAEPTTAAPTASVEPSATSGTESADPAPSTSATDVAPAPIEDPATKLVAEPTFALGDLVWLDENPGDGGQFEPGIDTPLDGVKVEVYQYTGDWNYQSATPVATATTDSNGRWVTTKLTAGKYYLVLPPAQFAAGGKYAGYFPLWGGSDDPNDDVNESGDHDAHLLPSGALRSGVVTLSYTLDAAGNPVGNGPANDNVANLDVAGLSDDFTNLTVDLALKPIREFEVKKVVDGYGAGTVSGYFSITVDCKVYDQFQVVGYPQTVRLQDGESIKLKAPLGATCRASEPNNRGADATTIVPEKISAGTGDDPIIVTNTYNHISNALQITKKVSGVGAGLSAGSYTFNVKCTLNGSTVYDDDVVIKVDGAGSSSELIQPIALGATCTVTEIDNGGADETPAPVLVDIVNNSSNDPVSVVFENKFSAGTLVLAKALATDTPDFFNTLSYDVDVTCQIERSNVRQDVFTGTVSVTPGQDTPIEVAGKPLELPVGTHCWIAGEPGAQGGTASPINHDWDSALVVTTGNTKELQLLTLGLTNSFQMSSLAISKTVTGGTVSGPFSFGVECTYPVTSGGTTTQVAYPLPAADAGFTLSNGESRTISVPVGATCRVTETDSVGAKTVTYVDSDTTGATDDGVATVPAAGATVEVINAYEPKTEMAELKVTKKVTGSTEDGPFGFSLACTVSQEVNGAVTQVPYPLPAADAAFTLSNGDSRTISVPVGATCQVTETDSVGAKTVTYVDSDTTGATDDGVATVPAAGATVEVINAYDPKTEMAALTVTKTVTGSTEDGPFSFSLECTVSQAPYALDPADANFELRAGESRMIYVPVGATCQVTETDSVGAKTVTYVDGDTTGDVDDGKVTVPATGATVSVINAYEPTTDPEKAALTVTKIVSGAEVDGPFAFSLSCTYQEEVNGVFITVPVALAPEDASFTLMRGGNRVIQVPVGSVCKVTETDSLEAVSVRYVDSDGSTDGEVTVPSLGAQVVVVNTFVTDTKGGTFASLLITKKVSGDDVAGPFSFSLSCTSLDTNGNQVAYDLKPEDANFTLNADETREVTVPVGGICKVVETDSLGAVSITYLDSDSSGSTDDGEVTIPENGSSVTVTNTYDPDPLPEMASLVVTKTVKGSDVEGPFAFSVSCTYTRTVDGKDVTLDYELDPSDAAFTLMAGGLKTIKVPVGAVCKVVETNSLEAQKITYVDSDTTGATNDGEATVPAGGAKVEVINTFSDDSKGVITEMAALEVTKTVTGSSIVGPFAFELSCTYVEEIDGVETELSWDLDDEDASFTLKAGKTRKIEVPVGGVCTVVETDSKGAKKITFVDSDETDGADDGEVTIPEDGAAVEVVNAYSTGTKGVDSEDDDDDLAYTGFAAAPYLAAAAVLLMGGVALIFARRRRSSE